MPPDPTISVPPELIVLPPAAFAAGLPFPAYNVTVPPAAMVVLYKLAPDDTVIVALPPDTVAELTCPPERIVWLWPGPTVPLNVEPLDVVAMETDLPKGCEDARRRMD
ncbi:hypothetical protein AA103193_1206 [Tanticharoenia sakaeratensis NBRC 103193]|nr:hypothetical protein AA103193_1206 [Tanticharoenia sakaeratensis NBRC 103193]